MKKFFSAIWTGILTLFGVKKCNEMKCTCRKGSLSVEHVVSSDREYMYMHYDDKNYRWYETSIVLKDYLDEDCSGEVVSVNNVFQVMDNVDETSADVHVVMCNHDVDGYKVDVVDGFWLGNYPLNDAEIKLTFNEAFNKLMKANCVKPHSRKCVLRSAIGPKSANPQYIFGNTHMQVFVDAVTGDVNSDDPVFDGFKLKKPLGEWP